MNDEHLLPNGMPLVKFEDASEFLSKRTTNPCEACGHSKWNVFVGIDGGNGLIGCGLSILELPSGKSRGHSVPLVTSTCKKCFNMRLHGVYEISRWVAEGKPEFKDDD